MKGIQNIRKEKGITLIALIVTIIVLIILAAVTIYALIGENNIIEDVKNAKEVSRRAEAVEIMTLKLANLYAHDYIKPKRTLDLQEIANALCDDEDIEYVIKKSKETASLDYIDVSDVKSIYTKLKAYPYEFEISDKLKIESVRNTEGEAGEGTNPGEEKPKEEILIAKVKENPSAYYGKKVSGYEANGISDWRIFYADDENVFLITTDYIPAEKAVACNPTMTIKGDCWVNWESAPEVADTTNATKFSPVTEETTEWNGNYATYENGRCVSTLLDINNWKAFLDKEDGTGKGKMAIGSPTLSMWVASWNTKYPEDKLYCRKGGSGVCFGPDKSYYSTSYPLWNKGPCEGYDTAVTENMYFPRKSSGQEFANYWMASVGTFYDWALCQIDGRGFLIVGAKRDTSGLRPVVCLNSNVKTTSTETDDVITITD